MKKYLIVLLALLFASPAFAASLTVVKNSDLPDVTAGIPLAPCAMTDVSNFTLLNAAGVEVPVFIKSTLSWPASKCAGVVSVRAIKLQFAFAGAQTYTWSLAPRTLPDRPEVAVGEIASSNAAKAGYKEPAHFAINDPAYLVTTGLIPPTTIADNSNYDKKWYPAIFEKRTRVTDFKTSIGENWLFDAVSSIYQQAIRTGSVAQYREAYLEHEFYMSKMDVVNAATLGSFSLSIGDIKYIYLTPMKLHLALTGDDSWSPNENAATPDPAVKDRTSFIRYIANKAFEIRGIGVAYTDVGARFTERESGFALQQMVAAYEMTGDAAILASITTAVNTLSNMIASNPDGLGNHGYLSHSWDAHEGDYPAYIGMTPVFSGSADSTKTVSEVIVRNPIGDDYLKMGAGSQIFFKPYGPVSTLAQPVTKNADGTLTLTLQAPAAIRSNQYAIWQILGDNNTRTMNFTGDRIFSPWMQAVLADGLWQLYNLSDDAVLKTKVSDMLLGFGRNIASYAIDGAGLKPATKALIESAFGVKVVSSSASGSRGGVYPRYVANARMNGAPPDYIDYMSYDGAFSDQHTPEALFQLSLAIRFETDPAKKVAMQAVASDMLWYFDDVLRAVGAGDGYPPRYFNWTNKQNAYGTYQWVLNAPAPHQ